MEGNETFEEDTGKYLSEALIFASTKSQYDDRLFVELQVQYMKIPSSNLGSTWNCFGHSEQFLYTTCYPHGLQKKELLTKIYLYHAFDHTGLEVHKLRKNKSLHGHIGKLEDLDHQLLFQVFHDHTTKILF